jgi:hypothetical protein
LHLQLVLVSVALAFLLLSSALPWLIVNLIGKGRILLLTI